MEEQGESGKRASSGWLKRRLMGILLAVIALNLIIPPYIIPTEGEVTSRYFVRVRPEARLPALEIHHGIDFGAPRGTTVRASKTGVVADAGFSDSLGNFVLIDHWLGFTTLYAHLDAVRVRDGQFVFKWQPIGTVGQTGRATGPHLHFEVAFMGRRLPPGIFLLIDAGRRSLFRALAPGRAG